MGKSRFQKIDEISKDGRIKKSIVSKKEKALSVREFKEITGFDFSSSEDQLAAFRSRTKFSLIGGLSGGGKSAFLSAIGIHHCLSWPGAIFLYTRAEIESFMQNNYEELMKWVPGDAVKQHRRNLRQIHFKNGSILMYGRNLADQEGLEKIKSLEVSGFAVDQAEPLSEAGFHILSMRLRLDVGAQLRGWISSNVCGGWIKQLFVVGKNRDFGFYPLSPYKNRFLPDGYLEELEERLPGYLREAWLNGNWDLAEESSAVFPVNLVEESTGKGNPKRDGIEALGIDTGLGLEQASSVIMSKSGTRLKFEFVSNRAKMKKIIGKVESLLKGKKNIPIFVDAVQSGGVLCQELEDRGFLVIRVKGSERASQSDRYFNKRSELMFTFRELLESHEAALPDDRELTSQMLALKFHYTNDNRLAVSSKKDLQKLGISTDKLDACVLACLKGTQEHRAATDGPLAMWKHWQQEEKKKWQSDVERGLISVRRPGEWTGARFIKWSDLTEDEQKYWEAAGYPEKYWKGKRFFR